MTLSVPSTRLPVSREAAPSLSPLDDASCSNEAHPLGSHWLSASNFLFALNYSPVEFYLQCCSGYSYASILENMEIHFSEINTRNRALDPSIVVPSAAQSFEDLYLVIIL